MRKNPLRTWMRAHFEELWAIYQAQSVKEMMTYIHTTSGIVDENPRSTHDAWKIIRAEHGVLLDRATQFAQQKYFTMFTESDIKFIKTAAVELALTATQMGKLIALTPQAFNDCLTGREQIRRTSRKMLLIILRKYYKQENKYGLELGKLIAHCTTKYARRCVEIEHYVNPRLAPLVIHCNTPAQYHAFLERAFPRSLSGCGALQELLETPR